MAQVGRLAGAILARSGNSQYFVGNPKEPCGPRRRSTRSRVRSCA
jgi:hypothetical protein